MLSTSPPRFGAAAAASDVVVLPSSPEEYSPLPTRHLTPERVARWALKDIEDHIFFMVWVCGVPVHVRYIVHILAHSAVSAGQGRGPIPHGGSTRESLTTVAQAGVLAPVCRRAAELRQAISRWPTMATLRDLPNHKSLSELMTLGILRDEPKNEDGGILLAEGAERRFSSGSVGAAAPFPASSPSCSTIRAGAVTPAERFENVTALALCTPAERDGTSRSFAPSATWCARAYWTAFSQAQQWIAGWPTLVSGAMRHPDSLGGTDAASASAWLLLRPACTPNTPGRRRLRGGDVSITEDVAVVDADEGDSQGSAGGVDTTSVAAKDVARNSKAQRREEAEVIVIDSDDDGL